MLRSVLVRVIPQRMLRLATDEHGVSAVEFALILPLMLTLFFGGVEVSQSVAIDRKVTLTARTVADLTSQAASVTGTDVTTILAASSAILSPYPISNAKITVASIKIDATSKVTMEWSKTHPAGGTVAMPTIPDALIVPNTYLIWGDASYEYKPVIGYVLTGTLNLKDHIFMRPRLSDKVTLSP